MRLSYTWKVFAAILGLILLILGCVIYAFELGAGRIADSEIDARLNKTREAFENYHTQTRRNLAQVNYYIRKNSSFLAYMAAAIEQGETESMVDQYDEVRNFSNCDFMIVNDAEGNTVLDTAEIAGEAQHYIEDYMDKVDQYAEALANGETADLPMGGLSVDKRLYTVVMSPIISGGAMLGYVMVGYKIDDTTAASLGKVTNCDILFLTESAAGPALVASFNQDMDASQVDKLAGVLAGTNPDAIFNIQLGEKQYRGFFGNLRSAGGEVVGRYITLRSIRMELAPFNKISRVLLLIGIVAILIFSPLSIAAARGVTRPVNQLVKAIGKVREGVYDENLIRVSSRDEIGLMAQAFKDMVQELREQQELIRFLEQTSTAGKQRDIDDEATVDLRASAPNNTLTSPSRTFGDRVRHAMESGETLPSGFHLGKRYRIQEVLGRGGMGIVYRAHDETLDEIVAIKMLHIRERAISDMIKSETKLARKVTHRNILRIFDLGEVDGIQFISMEFVKGTTVKALLKRVNRLPLPIGLRICRQVCSGLEAAHEEGIIHGDIKPENVILNARGEIKIMDFGVARVAHREISAGENVSGSPAYMSPEQFQGDKVDSRSDIYSLGIMMFECFSGETPFSGETIIELFRNHMTTPVPNLARINLEVPMELVKIIEKALAKDPDQRWPTANTLLDALNAIA